MKPLCEWQYEGTPRCQDCKWQLDTPLTDNCPCQKDGDFEIYLAAYKEARRQQKEKATQ